MAKKLSLLLAAVAVVALAVPAFASAAAVTQPAGTLLGVGSTVTGVSTNTVTKTTLGELSCNKVTVNGVISENNGTNVMANTSGAGTTAECFVNKTQKIEITDATLLTLTATPTTKTVQLTFEAHLPGGIKCHYTGTVALSYVALSSTISINGPLTATPPACGSATITGDFALTAGGKSVVLD